MTNYFLGEIAMVGCNFAPRGWALCSGQILPIAQNTALFSLLGTTFGGNGQTTFGLPDLRGRRPIHFGQGPGLNDYPMGEQAGVETVAIQVSELPAHTHSVAAVPGPGTSNTPAGNLWAAWGDNQYSGGTPIVPLHPTAIGLTGGGTPHSNIAPYEAITFIIAITGIYPSRN